MIWSGKATVAGVMGWPVSHSHSPRPHGYRLERHGIDGAYIPMAVPPDRLEPAVRGLPALGTRGANVTLSVEATVYDIVYVALETGLLAAARARGNVAVDGLGMLLHQARPGFEAWFGICPEVDEDPREFVLQDLRGD